MKFPSHRSPPLEGVAARGAAWSGTYRKYPAAVNAHLVKVCRGLLGIALTQQAALFVLERNKESGRVTLDCTRTSSVADRDGEATHLNTEDVRVGASRCWGAIAHHSG